MIFGNKNYFAIEAMVEQDIIPPSHPWGRMCIWVEGNAIGYYKYPHCGLYPVYDNFKTKIEELNSLWIEDFLGLSDKEIWNFLDGLLYGYHGNEELVDESSLEDSSKACSLFREWSRADFPKPYSGVF